GEPLSLERLRLCAQLPEGITIPGRRDFSDPARQWRMDEICWRFLGGFFAGDAESICRLDASARELLVEMLPQLSWETNHWMMLEAARGLEFRRYTAGHDETFLDFPELERKCELETIVP